MSPGTTRPEAADQGSGAEWSRRRLLRALGLLVLGHATSALTGCAPIRVATRWAPAEYGRNGNRLVETLRMFVATVVPGADPAAEVARILTDDRYPFHPYVRTFVADLDRRTRRSSDRRGFADAGPGVRAAVIAEGLRADTATRTLYVGAVFMIQVAFYTGMYGEDGCPLIGFDGAARLVDRGAQTHRPLEEFRGLEITRDGNPA